MAAVPGDMPAPDADVAVAVAVVVDDDEDDVDVDVDDVACKLLLLATPLVLGAFAFTGFVDVLAPGAIAFGPGIF